MNVFDISQFKGKPVVFDQENIGDFNPELMGIQSNRKSYSNPAYGGYSQVGYAKDDTDNFSRVIFSLEDVEMMINFFEDEHGRKYSLNIFLDPENNEVHKTLVDNIAQSYIRMIEYMAGLNGPTLKALVSPCQYHPPKRGEDLFEYNKKYLLEKFNLSSRLRDVYINEDFSVEYGSDVRLFSKIDSKGAFGPKIDDINGRTYKDLSRIAKTSLTGLLSVQLGILSFSKSGISWNFEARAITIRKISISDEVEEARQKYMKKVTKQEMDELEKNVNEILTTEETEEDDEQDIDIVHEEDEDFTM